MFDPHFDRKSIFTPSALVSLGLVYLLNEFFQSAGANTYVNARKVPVVSIFIFIH